MKKPFCCRMVMGGAIGCILFAGLFARGYHGRFDFWASLTIASFCCAALAVGADPGYRLRIREALRGTGLVREIAVGVGSAALLYGLFAVGNGLARAWFPFAGPDIEAVYALKQGAATWRIVFLIVLVIAPAEELFWRGFLQHRLSEWKGAVSALAISVLLYAAVHLPSGNAMLVSAALAGGFFWSALYAWRRSLAANIVSHIAWDLAVFVFWPLG